MTKPAPLQESQTNTFVCDCDSSKRTACMGEGYYKEYKGLRYCVLHYPGKEKAKDFKIALEKKLESKDYNFCGVWFPESVDFQGIQFGADANFNHATFSAHADFSSATFSAIVYFGYATFSADVNFVDTTFSADANFYDVTFSAGANFCHATFNAVAHFNSATFCALVYFYSTIFKEYAYFAGSREKRKLGTHPRPKFEFAHFEKPDRVSFHTLDLQPRWFINVDSRKFVFTDVEFKYDLIEEIESMKEDEVEAPHRLLAIACRQLAVNAEENHRYREASRLRYDSFEARRIERYRGFVPWRLDWWYWLASGYGESVSRAFIVFFVLISLFMIGYKSSDFDPSSRMAITKTAQVSASPSHDTSDTRPRRLGWREAALYSFNVSILQKPEPKPLGLWGNTLVSLETVLGPAQAALLALAVRRRFMR